MAAGIIFRHDCVIMDACCVINLYESGHMGEILESIPKSVMIAAYVREEEVARFDLQPFIERGLLTIVSIESEDEEIAFVNYAAVIGDDGEAATGAIAVHRSWAIATDDRKATNLFAADAPHIQLVSTPDLMKHWADVARPSSQVVRSAIEKIEAEGHYSPGKRHALYAWWKACVEHS